MQKGFFEYWWVIALIVLIGGAWWFTGGFSFGKQSIIGVSNIIIDLGKGPEEVINATIAANTSDLIWFIPKANILNASQGQFSQVTRDVQIRVVRQGAFCKVTLNERSQNTLLGPQIYYESVGSYRRSVPILVGVARNYLGTDLDPSGTGDFVGIDEVDACSHAQSTAPCLLTESVTRFQTDDLGVIRIENLGAFDGPNAEQCPDAGEIALVRVPSTGQLKAVDKDALINRLTNLSFTNCLNVFTLPQCFEQLLTGQLAGLDALPSPDGHIVSKFSSLNTSDVQYNLDAGSAVGLLNINMNTKFIGAIVFQPPNVAPVIAGGLFPDVINVGQTGNMVVKIRNNGDTGDVRVRVSSLTNHSSIAPPELTKSVPKSVTVDFPFSLACVSEGQENLSLNVEGLGLAGQSVTGDVSFTCGPRSGGGCGDGVCAQPLEPFTCPQDCTTLKHTACVQNACVEVAGAGSNSCAIDSDCTGGGDFKCALWEKPVLVNETSYLIDVWIFKFFPTGSVLVPTCVTNWGLIAMVVIAIGLGYGAYKVVSEK